MLVIVIADQLFHGINAEYQRQSHTNRSVPVNHEMISSENLGARRHVEAVEIAELLLHIVGPRDRANLGIVRYIV